MAGQTLTTTILINAKAGNGFEEIGNTLMELGSLVSGISNGAQEVIKDSLGVYRNYEKSMAEARGALGTKYGKDTSELEKVMAGLDEAAQEWAATTIFHTNDVGNAIADAAHAGWSYEQIMQDMPAVMRLAQAGGMDLSDTVSYITASMKAAGVEVDELDSFIDAWAYSANSSRGTIREFGDTFTRMQSTMRFASSTEELMTMVAVIADMGSTGSEAGTMLRNAILRLAAPTKKASDLMASLGVSSEEMNEALTVDEGALGIEAAGEQLQQFGFSAYDTHGKLKPVLQQFSELYEILNEMAGGEEIAKNATTLPILETIFGKRGVIAGMDMLQGAAESYGGLYESLMAGDQEGYATWLQETMWATLDNKIEAFQSKVEHLQSALGESLAPDLEALMDSFGSFIDGLAGMDDAKMAGFVGGLETLAALGPGLMTLGIGASAIGKIQKILSMGELAPVILGASAAAAAIFTLENALRKISEADYQDQFGDLSLDNSEIVSFANGIAAEFNAAYDSINQTSARLGEITEEYKEKISTLSEDLSTAFVTGSQLSDKQQEDLIKTGQEAMSLVNEGIDTEYSRGKSALDKTFEGDTDNPLYQSLLATLESGYEETIAKANTLSQDLRKALFSAFEDGAVNAPELQGLKDLIDEASSLITNAQDMASYVAGQELLRKSQSLGIEGINEVAGDIASVREGVIAPTARALAEDRYKNYISKGASEEDVAAYKEMQDRQLAGEAAKFDVGIIRSYMAAMAGSKLSDEWASLVGVADTAIASPEGKYDQAAMDQFRSVASGVDVAHLQEFVNSLTSLMYNSGDLQGAIEYFSENGMEAEAQAYQRIQAMQKILAENPYADIMSGQTAPEPTTEYGALLDVAQTYDYSSVEEMAAGVVGHVGELGSQMVSDILAAMGDGFTEADISGYMEQYLPTEPVKVPAQIELEETDLTQSADTEPITVDTQANTDAAQNDILALDGQDLTENVDGDISGLSSAIDSQDGRTITAHVNGDTSGLASAINSLGNRTVYVNVAARKIASAFASGGRATTASIFGEAGPEWAIPEEHTERTAALLDAARQASGFTWPDLLARFGGLNANPENSPTTLIYSPTINATDASGVESILRADKFRLERWFEERQMRDRMEVYA